MKIKGLLYNIIGIIYVLTGTFLLFVLISYIYENITSILKTGQFLETGLTKEENFAFDIFFTLFFLSSLLFTSIQFFNYLYPQITRNKEIEKPSVHQPIDTVLYISTDDEVAVINAIQKLQPRAYKFEIANETNLSRMKIHRILQRLEKRDIVKIINIGRNRKVTLADWLISDD